MTALTMPNGRRQSARDEAELASLVAARLCHDLVSPLGAIGNGVELLEMSGDFPGISKSPELALITESVRSARARVRFFRTAFGHAPVVVLDPLAPGAAQVGILDPAHEGRVLHGDAGLVHPAVDDPGADLVRGAVAAMQAAVERVLVVIALGADLAQPRLEGIARRGLAIRGGGVVGHSEISIPSRPICQPAACACL